jgi:hypothetical protein
MWKQKKTHALSDYVYCSITRQSQSTDSPAIKASIILVRG